MKKLCKKLFSLLLTIMFLCNLALPTAAESSEGVICTDCADMIGLSGGGTHDCEEHTFEESLSAGLPAGEIVEEIAPPPAEEGANSPLPNTAPQLSEAVANAQAGAYYSAFEQFSGESVAEYSAHNRIYAPGGGLVLELEQPASQSIVSSEVAFYLVGETLYRRHIETGATQALGGLEHVKIFSVVSNNVVRWNIPSDPACYGMSPADIFDYDENNMFPFICYEYDYTTGQTQEITKAQQQQEFWTLEAANSTAVSALDTYSLYGLTLPLAGYESGKYYNSHKTSPCTCHNSGKCRDGEAGCQCDRFKRDIPEANQYQCNGFSNKILHAIVKHLEINNFSYDDNKIADLKFSGTVDTASEWAMLFKLIPVGSRLRFFIGAGSSQHYIVVLAKNENGIVVYDANGGSSPCQINIRNKTYAEMASSNWQFRDDAYFLAPLQNHDHHYTPDHSCYLIGCTSIQPHQYAYNGDETGHTRYCTVCNQQDASQAHSYTAYVNVTNTHHGRKCSVCNYVSTMNHTNVTYTSLGPSSHTVTCSACETHSMSHALEVGHNSTSHFMQCTLCNYANTEASEDHTLVYEALIGGNHRRKCTGCSYVTAQTEHSFSNWAQNGSVYHRKVCSLCGQAVEAAHTYGNLWTPHNASQHKKNCTACNYQIYANHSMGSWADYSNSQHRRKCGACSDYAYGSHGYGSWVTYTTTAHKRNCSGCGKLQTAGHSFSAWGSISATQHQRVCITCGQLIIANHSLTYQQIARNKISHTASCAVCGYSGLQAHRSVNGRCTLCGFYTGISIQSLNFEG